MDVAVGGYVPRAPSPPFPDARSALTRLPRTYGWFPVNQGGKPWLDGSQSASPIHFTPNINKLAKPIHMHTYTCMHTQPRCATLPSRRTSGTPRGPPVQRTAHSSCACPVPVFALACVC